MKRLSKTLIYSVAVIVFAFVFYSVERITSTADSDVERTARANDVNDTPPVTKPMIIWFHSGSGYSLESLKTAISSGLITHVILLYMHRADGDWKTNTAVREAIEIVKKSDTKLIWCRDLWPYYKNEGIKLSDFFDSNYYIREINYLRSEGKQIEADFVALDLEPYGYSPMKHYMKSKYQLDGRQRVSLQKVIRGVVEQVGEVDFVLPAGAMDLRHPYNIMSSLGKNRICESTYYDNSRRLKNISHPYEIFGAYVNTIRRRAENPSSPYFLVSDVFERSELWSEKKGLFLFSDRHNCLQVAKTIVDYSKTLPHKNMAGGGDSDTNYDQSGKK